MSASVDLGLYAFSQKTRHQHLVLSSSTIDWFSQFCYRRQGGYICARVCLFVCLLAR